MKKQTKNQILKWRKPVITLIFYFIGVGALHAQYANKDGFQAAGNKQLGFALKEHRDGSWRGDILSRISQPNNWDLTISNFVGTDIVFTGGGTWNDTGSWTELFRVTGNGNVGIGTSNPLTKLSVNGDVTVYGDIDLKGDNDNTIIGHMAGQHTLGSGNSYFGLLAGHNTREGGENSNFGNAAGLSITMASGNSNFGYEAGSDNVIGNENSNFGKRAGYNITGNGNTSLGSRAGRDANDVHYSVFLGYAAGADFNHVTFEDGINPIDAGKSVFVLNNQSQLHNPLLFGTFVDNVNHDDPASPTTPGSMAQLAINTHHLVDSCALTVSGAVHIGPKNLDPTNFPMDTLYDDYLLWVERGIVTEDLAIAEVDEWADHVFDPSYNLASLDDVEQYIREHGHLPNIPSEAEVRKSGYSLQQINAKFLEKIEELTLHAIEHEKMIKQLKEQQSVQLQALAAKVAELEASINK